MDKIGIFYGSSTGNCQTIADLLKQEIDQKLTCVYDVAFANPTYLTKYKNLIFGISTWGIAELQEDWSDFLTEIEEIDLKNKKIALYGLGDQKTYADSFVDAMGLLYDFLIKKNCSFVGYWPLDSYSFQSSKAIRNGKFVGLPLDEDMQPEHSMQRIKSWVKMLKTEFY